MMRIVAGDFRGRGIDSPQGDDTRPTTDRVREALFSSLYSRRGGFEGAVVLDAFAGSGALGLEALSRGASQAVFFERDQKAAATCEANARKLGLDEHRARVVRRDVLQAPPSEQTPPFDLVFLDPPYAYDPKAVVAFVLELQGAGVLHPDALVVYEHAKTSSREAAAAVEAAGCEVISTKKYGKTGVTLWRPASEHGDDRSNA